MTSVERQCDQARAGFVVVNRPCVCCGVDDDEPYLRIRFPGYRGVFHYRRCRHCGVVFNSPRIADLGSLYDDEYFYFWTSGAYVRRRVIEQVDRLIKPVEPLLRGKRVLEVGAGRGFLVYALGLLGYDAHGVELSEDACEIARRSVGIALTPGTIEAFADHYDGPPFDLIVSSCVIEHVGDPESFLSACARLLSKGGALVMDTPNVASGNIKRLGRAWEYFQQYHVYLFDCSSMDSLLNRSGFETVRCFSYHNSAIHQRTARRRKQMRLLMLALHRVGLYRHIRRLHRGKRPPPTDAFDALRSLSAEDLRKRSAHEETSDAGAPLAERGRGDHIVIIGRRRTSSATSTA